VFENILISPILFRLEYFILLSFKMTFYIQIPPILAKQTLAELRICDMHQ